MLKQDFYNRPPTDFSNSNAQTGRISNRTLAKLSVVLHGLIFFGAAFLLVIYFHHASEAAQNFFNPTFGENFRGDGEFSRQFAGGRGAESQLRPLIEPFFIIFFAWALGLALHFLAVFILAAPIQNGVSVANATTSEPKPSFPAQPFYPANPYQQSQPYNPYYFDRSGQLAPPPGFEGPQLPMMEQGWPRPFGQEHPGVTGNNNPGSQPYRPE